MTSKFAAGILAGGLALAWSAPSPAALTMDVDFSLDAQGFFNAGTSNGQAARAVVVRAAQMLGDRIVDNLSPITPAPAAGDTWNAVFTHPGTGQAGFIVSNLNIPARTLKVYVGARPLSDDAIGLGGPGGYTGNGGQAFLDALQFRGQEGARGPTFTDFGPWGGSVAFDNTKTWSLSLAGPVAGQNDLYTVALHEIAHVLGFGTSRSWSTFHSGNLFTGSKSRAANGGANVPLYDVEVPPAHWQIGVKSTVGGAGPLQETSMSPAIPVGSRKRFTVLDFAGLDDIGWDIARPGDANADGSVDFNDLAVMAQSYNTSAPLMRWSQGDFNYDQTVDFNDLALLAQNYNTTGVLAPPVGAASEFGQALATDWEAARAAAGVPEPGGTLALFMGIALLKSPRRARS
jgi:hypothetical protein